MTEPVVHVVHCVDTEGPLFESLDATFIKLSELFGLDLQPSNELLNDLQNRNIDLGGIEDAQACAWYFTTAGAVQKEAEDQINWL